MDTDRSHPSPSDTPAIPTTSPALHGSSPLPHCISHPSIWWRIWTWIWILPFLVYSPYCRCVPLPCLLSDCEFFSITEDITCYFWNVSEQIALIGPGYPCSMRLVFERSICPGFNFKRSIVIRRHMQDRLPCILFFAPCVAKMKNAVHFHRTVPSQLSFTTPDVLHCRHLLIPVLPQSIPAMPTPACSEQHLRANAVTTRKFASEGVMEQSGLSSLTCSLWAPSIFEWASFQGCISIAVFVIFVVL